MPKTKISEFDTNPDNNTDINSINIAEGCPPSGINNAIRQLMADLKEFQTGAGGDPFNGAVNGTVGATTPNTGAFTTLSASGNVTLSGGTANGVAYLNGSKVLTTGSALVFDGTNLGVGTASPAQKLDVVGNIRFGNTTSQPFLILNNTSVGSWKSELSFQNGSSAKWAMGVDINASGNNNFYWYDAAVGTERMRLDASGNLGIGTSSPSYKLQVTNSTGIDTEVAVSNSAGLARYGTRNSGNAFAGSFTAGTGFEFWSAGSERMRIDSSGNVGIGTSSPQTRLQAVQVGTGVTVRPIMVDNAASSGTSQAGISFANGGIVKASINAAVYDNDFMTFCVGGSGNSERMRIDAGGNLLVGTTSTINSGRAVIDYSAVGGRGLAIVAPSNANGAQSIHFYAGSTQVGNVSVTTTATSYNSGSDYRLKEDIAPMTGALDKVAQLKPCTFTWKINGSSGQGFIAHELQEVVPDCVTGEKDAVDAEGNPVYQGIDTSFLVATLTAAIQEQQAIINDLTNRLTALENK